MKDISTDRLDRTGSVEAENGRQVRKGTGVAAGNDVAKVRDLRVKRKRKGELLCVNCVDVR